MSNKLLNKKVLCSILAIGTFGFSGMALANSGGDFNLRGDYIGLYPNGSNVIIDEAITGIAYGSSVSEGIASNNTVTVSADCRSVVGAYVEAGNAVNNNVVINKGVIEYIPVYGARVEAGNAKGNSVVINGGDIYSAVGASIDEGIADGNIVTVNEGTVTAAIAAYIDAGTANNNSVIINGGTVSGAVGAYVTEGNANVNSVVIKGGEVSSAIGASVDIGNAEGNSVVIDADTVISRVAGAIVNKGNAINNYVEINDGKIDNSYVYGAKVDSGNAEGNMVVINNGDVNGRLYAAKVENGDAINNMLIINNGTVNADNGAINGILVHEGNAHNNSIVINGGEIHSSLDSGVVMTFGNSTDNSVVINDGKIFSYSITGGNVSGKGNVKNNNVIINGGTITNTQVIKGGFVSQGNAIGNSVVINNGEIIKEQDERTDIYGASVTKGDAEGNAVIINDGKISYSEIVGASATEGDALNNYVIVNGGKIIDSATYGAKVKVGDAIGNTVVINNGTTGEGVRGALITENGSAEGNTVIINGGSISGAVYGATIESDAEGKVRGNGIIFNGGSVTNGSLSGAGIVNGTAESNYVVVNSDKLTEGYLTDIYGADILGEGIAENNTVIINSGNVLGNIYGGKVYEGNAYNNYVNINGGKITGIVYGGYSENGTAECNVITVSGDADLSEAILIAGYEKVTEEKITRAENAGSSNIIKLNGWSGSVAGISGTDVIEINGGTFTENGILYITGASSTDLGGTTVKVNSVAGGQNLTSGSKLAIITAGDGVSLGDITTEINKDGILAGVASVASGNIVTDDQGNIILDITNVKVQNQTAITTETRAAAAAFVNQGAEAVADNLNILSQSAAGINTFATVSGSNSKYKTGSYVDINGWNTVIGIADTKEAESGKISYGAFFENGSGNYNTYNEFDGSALRGDGNVVYNGGGVMLRADKANGFYAEAAIRGGMVKNEVSNALTDGNKTYGFKTENAYYGGHIGIGKIFKLENGKAWDIYGKYFHMYHEGDSVEIAKDKFEFDSVDSNRLRIGARFTESQSDKLTSYYGLAWDYEFSGDAKGTAAGYDMHTPSLEGSTVIGEIGFRYTPGKESPWYFDANVKGYAGMQQGISGSVQAVYSF